VQRNPLLLPHRPNRAWIDLGTFQNKRFPHSSKVVVVVVVAAGVDDYVDGTNNAVLVDGHVVEEAADHLNCHWKVLRVDREEVAVPSWKDCSLDSPYWIAMEAILLVPFPHAVDRTVVACIRRTR
jgi:hypothetical protein